MKVLIYCLLLSCCCSVVSAQVLPFKGGHSHNDYHQKRPLWEALDHGMVSIEADVFLKNGELLVGHTTNELQKSRTLDGMYLNPLINQVSMQKNKFKPHILLIDIKDKGVETYTVLEKLLARYATYLTSYNNGIIQQKQITIILSGDRPVEVLRSEKQRLAFIDGRLTSADMHDSPQLMPLLSDDWKKYFTWNGVGHMPADQFARLTEMVANCHQNKQLIRFWDCPDGPETQKNFWMTLNQAGVDLIGTDCPACLEKFLKKNRQL